MKKFKDYIAEGASSFGYEVYMPYTFKQLADDFHKQQKADLVTYGSDPYSGSLATLHGIKEVSGKKFASRKEANDYILDNSEKWEHALAVKFVENGKEKWLVGGWLAS